MWFRSSGPDCEECHTTYWSGSEPVPQPSTMAWKLRFLMCSLSSVAHSRMRMSTPMPTSRSEAWMISATFLRSSLPWFVSSSKVKGLPSFSSSPWPLRFHPASASSAAAFLGS